MLRHLIFASLCCVILALPPTASANDPNVTDNACNMIITDTFKQILGGSSIELARDITAQSSKQNGSGVLHSVCNGYIWSGAKPGSRAAALAALRSGRGSAFAIDTWEPDDQSEYVDTWVNKGFSRLVKSPLVALPDVLAQVLPGFKRYQVSSFKPSTFGALGARGVRATPMPGVATGGAVWWRASEAMVAFVSLGVGAGRPLVPELNKVGALLVANFGMLG